MWIAWGAYPGGCGCYKGGSRPGRPGRRIPGPAMSVRTRDEGFPDDIWCCSCRASLWPSLVSAPDELIACDGFVAMSCLLDDMLDHVGLVISRDFHIP